MSLPPPVPTLAEALALPRVELMARTLARIEALNPSLGALVSLRPAEELMAEAEAADAVPEAERGPLHGLPMAVKDLVATRGIRTTYGSPRFADHVPTADDPLAARLRAAGGILIGKTNVPEFGLGSHTFNEVFGLTRNPHAPSVTAGGSSGGAAAALAAGMLAVADGSDMMGSLRNPAAFCGCYGLRPSFGLVPATPDGDDASHMISTDGPMARDPADLGPILAALSVPDPLAFHPAPPVRAADLPERPRIAWIGDAGGAWPMDDGLLDAGETALRAVFDVVPAPLPVPAPDLWRAWTVLRHHAIAAAQRAAHADPAERALMKPELVWEVERGLALTGPEIAEAGAVRAAAFRAMTRLARTVDAIAMPAAQVWPFAVEARWPARIAGREMDSYHRWMECMVPVSLTGLPAIALPVTLGGGRNTGVQLATARGGDARLVALARRWHAVRPPDDPFG